MEACSGSHFLGRALREQGHDVRLMPAQYVKPYVKTNKSDCEFSASLRASSRAEHDSETVTLSHPVMPIADGLGS
jgi:transposase